jgi:hypothetical protein
MGFGNGQDTTEDRPRKVYRHRTEDADDSRADLRAEVTVRELMASRAFRRMAMGLVMAVLPVVGYVAGVVSNVYSENGALRRARDDARWEAYSNAQRDKVTTLELRVDALAPALQETRTEARVRMDKMDSKLDTLLKEVRRR